ncbi:oligoendopeptidase F [endosymbiont GvMRE of Glomus versiforme]|uniref:oligoendopeptidase F n=1 Tax=endosymbiont GvMRE of Glomus versiforme TaxID=2039283 RepID=UPI000EC75448|nr:oligoendopeptidase F [endosymbiont GvMRE of Glomus versiforme]RHZ37788.1 Oligoendopeptidase F [endosymbiont GvMRE of Glomus versiforme]
MQRKTANSQYKWNFIHLFPHQQEWEKQLNNLNQIIQKLASLRGKLNELENFRQYLQWEKELTFQLTKLGQYLHYADLDLTNLDFQKLNTLYTNKCQEINTSLSWIDPELKKIGALTITKWIKQNKDLQSYQHKFELFFRLAKYILPEDKEKLLSQVSISRHIATELYDTLAYADRQPVFVDYQGQKQKLTLALYTEIMEKSQPKEDQDFRYEVSQKWVAYLSNKKHSFAKIYEGILRTSVEELSLRGYQSTLEMGLIGNNIPNEVYATLIQAGQENAKLYREFLQIKKKFFDLTNFYATDNSLKIISQYQRKFTVEEAVVLIKKVLQILGPEYQEKLNLALQPGRIDYYEDTNKRDGAYSSGGNGVEPIILMNWDDTLNSVNTLIHELGHSVHTLFAEENQPYPNASYPIILAEVASTLNEHLLFDYLYQNSQTKEEKIYLLQSRIEEIVGTFFRQIQFAKFEWESHQMVERGIPLNADLLADLFQKINEEFGADILDKKDPNKKFYAWPRISHFFHSPYYVYKYAVAITVSFKLYQEIKENNITNLLKFLKAGGHKDPLDILQDISINLNTINIYQPLLNNLKEMIKELKKWCKTLNEAL